MTRSNLQQDHTAPRRVAAIIRRLHDRYGSPCHGNKDDPLDELVFILLSLMTRHQAFNRAFDTLTSQFSGWDDVRSATDHEIGRCIRSAGLAEQRTVTLRRILDRIHNDCNELSLSWLRDRPTGEAQAYLESLPGIGPKSARCVLMYSLGRPVLPIDTHTRRVATRLGWLRRGDRNAEHQTLETVVPAKLRYRFHTNALSLGRDVCLPNMQKCDACAISGLCPRILDSHN